MTSPDISQADSATQPVSTTPTAEFKMGKIFELIPAIMSEMNAIGRDQRNEQQRFNFRGIDQIYNHLQPLLAKHGVFTVPTILKESRSTGTYKSGGAYFHVVLRIRYRFFAKDGSYFDATVIGEGMDSGDKGTNKAESVAHKYAFTQVFAIRTDDVDPDAETHEVGNKAQPPAKTPPPRQSSSPHGDRRQAPTSNPTEKQLKRLYAIATNNGWEHNQVTALMMERYKKDSSKKLFIREYEDLVKFLEANPNHATDDSGISDEDQRAADMADGRY